MKNGVKVMQNFQNCLKFSLFLSSLYPVVLATQLEIPDREKRGIETKGNFIKDLRYYNLFHCTVDVGPMIISFFYDKCLKVNVWKQMILKTQAPTHADEFYWPVTVQSINTWLNSDYPTKNNLYFHLYLHRFIILKI